MAEMSSLGTESFNAPAIVPFKPMTPVMASPGVGATGSMENTGGEGLSIMESMKESLSGMAGPMAALTGIFVIIKEGISKLVEFARETLNFEKKQNDSLEDMADVMADDLNLEETKFDAEQDQARIDSRDENIEDNDFKAEDNDTTEGGSMLGSVTGAVGKLNPSNLGEKGKIMLFAAIAAGLGQEPQTVLNEGTQITSSGADTATYSYQSAMCVPSLPEGKWYFEVRDLFYYLDIGLMSGRFNEGVGNTNYIANNNRGTSLRFAPYTGKLRFTATGLSSNDDYQTLGIGATGTAPGTGDIFGIDYDTITNTFGVSKNGGTRYTDVVPTSDFVMLGKNIGMSDGTSSNQGNLQLNFGQNPTFNGNITPSGGTNSDGSYPDADGIGSFRYAPPTGYKALRFTGTTRPSGLNKPALNPEKYFNDQNVQFVV